MGKVYQLKNKKNLINFLLTFETEVNVQMQKMEDGWRITNPNELVAAILGGAASLIGL